MKTAIRNSWLIVILYILFSGITLAQKIDADKLRLQISQETNDTNRVKLLIKMGLIYSDRDSLDDRCFLEAYNISKKIHFLYGLAYYHYYEGIQLSKNKKYNEAIEKFKRSIVEMDSIHLIQHLNGFPLFEIRSLFNGAGKQMERFQYYTNKLAYYKIHGPIENTAACYHGLAGYYWALADYDKSIGYYIRARDVYRNFDSLGYANETQVIGSVYLEWGNLDKAEVYLKSALKDLTHINQNCFYCYHQIGDLYFRKKDYKQSLLYYFNGKKYCTTPELKAINLVNCASVHIMLNSLDSARFYLKSAEEIRQTKKIGLVLTNGFLEIDFNKYNYYVSTNNKGLALQSLKAALQEAQMAKYVSLVLKYTNELYLYLLKNGDSIQSLRYLVQYHTIQDSMNTVNIQARTASYEIEQQAQQRDTEIEQLQIQKATQRNYYLIGFIFLSLIAIGFFSRFRYKRRRDKELLISGFKKQLAQAETVALRAQMNPHFIFNCLNSINSFVIDQKHEIASDHLIKFSKLIRLILDNSRSETISLEKELETLKLYVVLESARYDNKFKCIYNIADDVNTNSIMIPPMLLQPYVENAIWHGLMQKEGEGTITIDIKKQDEEFLNISITDDGIGREKAAELKSKSATHKSHGLKVTSQRIEMMNKLNSTGAHVAINDLHDEQGNATGTKVELVIPF